MSISTSYEDNIVSTAESNGKSGLRARWTSRITQQRAAVGGKEARSRGTAFGLRVAMILECISVLACVLP